jgi:hypothetical protein
MGGGRALFWLHNSIEGYFSFLLLVDLFSCPFIRQSKWKKPNSGQQNAIEKF